jgi:hypothetical protein
MFCGWQCCCGSLRASWCCWFHFLWKDMYRYLEGPSEAVRGPVFVSCVVRDLGEVSIYMV